MILFVDNGILANNETEKFKVIGYLNLDIDKYVTFYEKANEFIMSKDEYDKYRDSIGYEFSNNPFCYYLKKTSRNDHKIIRNISHLLGRRPDSEKLTVLESNSENRNTYRYTEGGAPDYFVLLLINDSLFNEIYPRTNVDLRKNLACEKSDRKDEFLKVLYPVYRKTIGKTEDYYQEDTVKEINTDYDWNDAIPFEKCYSKRVDNVRYISNIKYPDINDTIKVYFDLDFVWKDNVIQKKKEQLSFLYKKDYVTYVYVFDVLNNSFLYNPPPKIKNMLNKLSERITLWYESQSREELQQVVRENDKKDGYLLFRRFFLIPKAH